MIVSRSVFLKTIATSVAGIMLFPKKTAAFFTEENFHKRLFGPNFKWGVATSAFQSEGAWNKDGKGPSIWDVFTKKKRKIRDKSDAKISCNFYENYQTDLALLKTLNFDSFRFSLAWSRIFPEGKGKINQKGIDFYNKVIDTSLELNIKPWITLYHWDLPQALEDLGGWPNRDIVNWFSDYTYTCAKHFGDRVKDWIVINEPAAFTTFGYLTGLHAPGRMGINSYLASVHHAVLCQSAGGKILRDTIPNGHIGTAVSCSYVEPKKAKPKFYRAAKRLDVVLNRLFIEPPLGLGYPTTDLHFLKKIEKFMLPGDEDLMKFDFDFIGLQNYFRVIGKPGLIPFIWANREKPDEDETLVTQMGWEVYPEGIYKILKKFADYPIKEFVITENGAAFDDHPENGEIKDQLRIDFFKNYLSNILQAKNEGVNITGYFVWSFIDNFEWSEGYYPKFGIVYNNRETQERIIKNSGYWFQSFLK
jgi:beta-glucosidase